MEYKDSVIYIDGEEISAARQAEYYISGAIVLGCIAFMVGLAIAVYCHG